MELAQIDCDSEHLDIALQAHERMESLITDLLTLARSGTPIEETETIDLAKIAESCWRTIETGEATLVTDTTQRIQANRSRLQQLLENLLRNAVKHADDTVTITIGDLADSTGFYVADDGPGIPAADQEIVIESGYSTSRTEPGSGLRSSRRSSKHTIGSSL